MKTDHKEIVEGYKKAFKEANGFGAYNVSYQKGWVSLQIWPTSVPKKHRIGKILEMTETLKRRAEG
jgi:hypothetical protein